MRRGEAIGLRWEDVDLVGAYLSVEQQITEVHGRDPEDQARHTCRPDR